MSPFVRNVNLKCSRGILNSEGQYKIAMLVHYILSIEVLTDFMVRGDWGKSGIVELKIS